MIHVVGHLLVDTEAEPGHPGDPEDEDEDERHEVVRIRQILAHGGSVLAFLFSQAPPQLVHGAEDVEIRVSYGQEAGGQHQNGQRNAVRYHVSKVQHADVAILVESALGEAQQRGTAEEQGSKPGEDHPTLAPSSGLDHVVAKWLSDCEVAVHGDPHECVQADGPQGQTQEASQPAHEVSVHLKS